MKKTCVLLSLIIVLSACSSRSVQQTQPMDIAPQSAPSAAGGTNMYGYARDSIMEVENAEYALAKEAANDNSSYEVNRTGLEADRKIIKKASITAETFDYEASAASLQDIVIKNGGYVERADTSIYFTDTDYSLKRGHYTLRVPQESFESAVDEIERIGKVLYSSMGGDDVTTQYYDIESRLTIKKEEEKRVYEMIAKAVKIEDLIELEKRLSEIRTDIEIYQTRLNSIDRLASFATITFNLTQVKEYTVTKIVDDNFIEKLKSSFKSSINFVIVFFQTIIIIFAGLVVPMGILAVIGLVAIFVYKKFRNPKKRNEMNDEK